MNNIQTKTMRDALIEQIGKRMVDNKEIVFLSDDFGAPALDEIREKFKERFINVGIAEQNLINVSAGFALEGFTVYAYGIAAFLTMRNYEQIRVNLSLLSQIREINVNLIGVGAGVSYEVSGPTHHCFEDISIMRVLPNFVVFSPSDIILIEKFVEYTINKKKPKYIRLDAKPLPLIYAGIRSFNLEDGFYELKKGEKTCLVSTGFMTHRALKIANELKNKISVGVIDLFLLKPVNEDLLFDSLKKYEHIITLEEAFIGKGGLDSLISDTLYSKEPNIKLKKVGFKDRYVFVTGSRDYLHKLNGLDEESIIRIIEDVSAKG